MKKLLTTLSIVAALTGMSTSADAALIWGDSAGSNEIAAFDASTGALVRQFFPGSGNGRGVVVVGNVVYYTVTGDGNIYELDATTGAPVGSFNTGQSSLSTISFDGTDFWLSDYSGSNNAYKVSTGGVLLKTISLANATGFTDGLEYFDGKLIANRSDGCCTSPTIYDVYDLDGNLLTSAFITVDNQSTGIAFDGTNFFTSDVFTNSVKVWDGTTGAFIKTVALDISKGGHLIEDLSVDFAGRPDTCGGPNQPPCNNTSVPEPGVLPLIGIALLGLARIRRRLS
jgi:hypothetical protein